MNFSLVCELLTLVIWTAPPDAERVNYKIPGFLAKFWELQQMMWTTNAGLTDRHTYDSHPLSWPPHRSIVSGLDTLTAFDSSLGVRTSG